MVCVNLRHWEGSRHCRYGLIALLILGQSVLRGDVPLGRAHLVKRCVKLVNIDSFPQYQFHGVIMKYGYQDDTSGRNNLIKSDTCLYVGYKFNTLNIYWSLKSEGFIREQERILAKGLSIASVQVSDTNPLIREEIEYRIKVDSSGRPEIWLLKITHYFNNGESPMEYHYNIGDEPLPTRSGYGRSSGMSMMFSRTNGVFYITASLLAGLLFLLLIKSGRMGIHGR